MLLLLKPDIVEDDQLGDTSLNVCDFRMEEYSNRYPDMKHKFHGLVLYARDEMKR